MKEDIDYKLVIKPDSQFYSIMNLTGPFASTVFTIGKVTIKEEKDQAILSFDFTIDDLGDIITTKKELEANIDFKNRVGDILATILMESNFGIGEHGKESTDCNTQTHNTQ
jgi:hypothetical protein